LGRATGFRGGHLTATDGWVQDATACERLPGAVSPPDGHIGLV
jgi:hypothetical protein